MDEPKLWILCGNVMEQLKLVADESIHCVVTSPPFYGLRDYGTEPIIWADGERLPCSEDKHEWGEDQPSFHSGQVEQTKWKNINGPGVAGNVSRGNYCQKCGAWRGHLGLEPEVSLYVLHLVQIFRKMRRVLRSDGTFFLNLGDSYAGSGAGGGGNRKGNEHGQHDVFVGKGVRGNIPDGLKPKDLMGIPWRVAFALQADGWWLRNEIIWAKGISGEACKYGWSGGVMPESVEDRFTKAHEHVFFFTKSPRYFFDAEAVKEDAVGVSAGNKAKSYGVNETPVRSEGEGKVETVRGIPWKGSEKRNRRDVWTIQRKNFRGAHFAVFPPELVQIPIQAGTSEKGCCSKCGSPWTRVIEKGLTAHDGKTECAYAKGMTANRLALLRQAARERGEEYFNQAKTIGWEPTCDCGSDEIQPCVVLDPFAGSGTTGKVALDLGRSAVLIELNPKYIKLIEQRCGVMRENGES